MSKKNIEATINLVLLIVGTSLLTVATDWKLALGVACLAVYSRQDIQ